jgi:hypothetical protein
MVLAIPFRQVEQDNPLKTITYAGNKKQRKLFW